VMVSMMGIDKPSAKKATTMRPDQARKLFFSRCEKQSVRKRTTRCNFTSNCYTTTSTCVAYSSNIRIE